MLDKILNQLIECQTIREEDKDLYAYGLQQGIHIIANILTTIIIGYLFGMVWQTILFMISYLPLRSFAGGFHARTQLRCYLYSIILTVTVLMIIKFIPWTYFIYMGLALVAGIIIFMLAPIEDCNKRLDRTEKAVYKKLTLIILVTELCVMQLSIGIGLSQISICISVSLFALSGMLVLGELRNKKLLNRHIELVERYVESDDL